MILNLSKNTITYRFTTCARCHPFIHKYLLAALRYDENDSVNVMERLVDEEREEETCSWRERTRSLRAVIHNNLIDKSRRSQNEEKDQCLKRAMALDLRSTFVYTRNVSQCLEYSVAYNDKILISGITFERNVATSC
ncbi:hypothetical protein PUN28_011466 [Cardiocondyla obscurior]|uniref:Uncharacterized protein n=1 Tax=Cardiocondyla obscurior TaxID=286306 RepID=A0AAW2FIF7_9HYME